MHALAGGGDAHAAARALCGEMHGQKHVEAVAVAVGDLPQVDEEGGAVRGQGGEQRLVEYVRAPRVDLTAYADLHRRKVEARSDVDLKSSTAVGTGERGHHCLPSLGAACPLTSMVGGCVVHVKEYV
nr:hypothetical protein [Streptomyces xanthochromogenes]